MPNKEKRKVTVRDFTFQRVRTITGSGVRLLFGPYAFVLVNRDGTPERSLDSEGVKRILGAVYKFPHEEKPTGGNGNGGNGKEGTGKIVLDK